MTYQLMLLVVMVAFVLLHEAGHVAAALSCGARIKGFGLTRMLSLHVYISVEPPHRGKSALVSAGGVLANLAGLAALRAVGLPTLGWLCLGVGLVQMLPVKHSDGYNLIVALLGRRERREQAW